MSFNRVGQFTLTILLLSTLNTSVQADWVIETDDGGTSDGQTCPVTIVEDNGDQKSFRRKVEQGFNIQGSGNPKFCRAKIPLNNDTELLSNLTFDNSEDQDGVIVEGVGGQRVINVNAISNGCAITVKKGTRVTFKNVIIRGSGGDGLCGKADFVNVENSKFEENKGIGLNLEGNQGTVKDIIADRNGTGLKISGTKYTVTGSTFKNNTGSGVVLENALNSVSKNNFFDNGQQALVSPGNDFKPLIESGIKLPGGQFDVLVKFDTDVERVELYRTLPKNNVTLIDEKKSGEFISRTVHFIFEASTGEEVFAIAFLNDTSTSAMSNVHSLSEFNSNTDIDCSAGPTEPGTNLVRNCSIGAGSPELQDTDCDGVKDNQEDKNENCQWDPSEGESDAVNSDSDGDGLSDGQEDKNKNGQIDPEETDPNDEDTDGDTIPDGTEDFNQNGVKNSKESDPTNADSDDDKIPDNLEDKNANGQWDEGQETKAFHTDTDLDGKIDNEEDKNKNGQVDPGESDPKKLDSDGDTLPDGSDLCPTDPDTTCSKPCIPGEIPDESIDTDFDGIADRYEDWNHNCVIDANETDPRKSDTDGDGSNDRLDPCPKNGEASCKSACVPGAQVAPSYDPDGDGAPLVDEDKNHNCLKDGNESDGYDPDTDKDGIGDGIEIANGMDPTKQDSDNDSLNDGDEDLNKNGKVDPGETNPKNPNSDGEGLDDATDPCPTNADPECSNQCIKGQIPSENKDADGDGVANKFEDLDHDCIRDGNEMSATSNDTDGDGILDGIEDTNANGIVDAGETDPKKTDTDNDGIPDSTEDLNKNGQVDPGETDPRLGDTDSDGAKDGGDSCPLNPTPDCEFECVPGVSASNPFMDSDGDGLTNKTEDLNLNCVLDFGETDQGKADSDGDGLPDGLEDKNKNGAVDPGETNPRNSDSDGDGISDGLEDKNHDGFVAQDECDPSKGDTDGDGLSDFHEDKNKNGLTDDGETSCYLNDSDFDGINDGQEDANKNGKCDPGETCANSDDTDGDGAKDGQELAQGTDPLINRPDDLKQLVDKGGCSLNTLAMGTTNAPFFGWTLILALGMLIPYGLKRGYASHSQTTRGTDH